MAQLLPNKLKTLELRQNDELVGTLAVSELDFPWVICHFNPTPVFANLKLLFDDELRLTEKDEDWQAWEAAYDKIVALGLRLVEPESQASINEFLLHIEGDQAWFRY